MWDLAKYQKKIAIIEESGLSLSYEELCAEGETLATKVGGRCLVFVLCENVTGAFVGYTAFVNHGIVPLMLNSHIDPDLLANLLEKYRPSFVWGPETNSAQLFGALAEIVYMKFGYSLIRTNYGVSYPILSDLCLLLTTSGSTGSPKFVRQSYENVRSNAEAIASYLRLDDQERPITTLPMNYTYGLSIINSHLLVGATILLTTKGILQKEFWNFFAEEKATSFGGVPYTYEMLDRLHFAKMDLHSLRYMTQAGGKLTPVLQQKFAEAAKEKGVEFVVMYGQCEATARMSYLPAEDCLKKPGSIGVPIPGGSFSILDSNGDEIREPEQVGELIYRGLNVTLGYAESYEDLNKGDEFGGILYTGDMAQVDQDGYYYIVGRKKRFLKMYGNRVNLDEIDQLLKTQFPGKEVASAGNDDHMYLFVTDPEIKDSVKEYVVLKTGINRVGFKVIVLDTIPKNDSGKVLYRELSKYYS